MSTPKTAQFKLRQHEFRALNRKSSGYSVSRGNWRNGEPSPLIMIKYPFVVKDV